MELIIGIIIVYLLVKFVVQPEYGMGCVRMIVVPMILFSFFGPIGVVVFVLYILFKKKNSNNTTEERKNDTIFTERLTKIVQKNNRTKILNELDRAKKLLADGIITHEEYEMIKNRSKLD